EDPQSPQAIPPLSISVRQGQSDPRRAGARSHRNINLISAGFEDRRPEERSLAASRVGFVGGRHGKREDVETAVGEYGRNTSFVVLQGDRKSTRLNSSH